MSNQNDLPDLYFEVKNSLLPHLIDRGFSLSLDVYDPKVFGNCVIKLQSTDFIVVVTRDRGEVFMDIGLSESPDRSFGLGVLIAFLDGAQEVLPLLMFEEERALFLQYIDQLLDKNLLAGQAEDIIRFRDEWSQRRWERLLRIPSDRE